MYLDMLRVVRFEGSVLALVEMNQDRHDFAVAQFAASLATGSSIAEPLGCPLAFVLLAEIIDMAEQF
jgi:hypothetical protein